MYRSGVLHDDEFNQAMVKRGLAAPGWPVEFGGQGRDPVEMLALGEEIRIAGGLRRRHLRPRVGRHPQGRHARAGRDHPQGARGRDHHRVGFTEPEAGSDVANAQARAVRDGDEWVINGSKMFTTNAHIGDYVFLLRPGPTPRSPSTRASRCSWCQPGVEVQAVFTLSGERTNITYYNDVRVSDAWHPLASTRAGTR